jgi:hypothetical protein
MLHYKKEGKDPYLRPDGFRRCSDSRQTKMIAEFWMKAAEFSVSEIGL